MNRKQIIPLVISLVLAGADSAVAGDGIGAGGALLELAGLGVALGCFLVARKVLSFVRGGRLAAGWQWLTSAFFLFIAGHALAMLAGLTLLPVAAELVIVLRVIGSVLLLLGIIKMRKALA